MDQDQQASDVENDVDVDKNDTVPERERERETKEREREAWLSFIVSALGAVSRCPTRNMPLSLLFHVQPVHRVLPSTINKSALDPASSFPSS